MAVADVIKFEGGPDLFAWKFPNSEIGTWSQLIVAESQEAILFKGGQAFDLFGPGRHTLETKNIPLLNKIVNLPFNRKSPFAAEVWFVNKVFNLDIKWGTTTPIQLQDPKYKIMLPVRSFGQFAIQIDDSRKFLIKLVGSLTLFDKENLVNFFRGLYLSKVKDGISSYLIKKNVSIVEINAYIDELSNELLERMAPTFSDYGIKLVHFYINDINTPEDDPAVQQLKGALAKKAEMDIIGYSYTQQRSFDTLEGAAKNPGGGQSGLMGAGVGLGMGMGIGGAFGNQMGNIGGMLSTRETKECPNCSHVFDKSSRFCPSCGFDTTGEQKKGGKNENLVECSACGNMFEKSSKFCPECGSPYDACSSCGADIPEGSPFCLVCGKKAPTPCPNCGVLQKDENSKFCFDCGFSLVKTCPNCDAQIVGTPKFCQECGHKL